jgi:hypothetical protein
VFPVRGCPSVPFDTMGRQTNPLETTHGRQLDCNQHSIERETFAEEQKFVLLTAVFVLLAVVELLAEVVLLDAFVLLVVVVLSTVVVFRYVIVLLTVVVLSVVVVIVVLLVGAWALTRDKERAKIKREREISCWLSIVFFILL